MKFYVGEDGETRVWYEAAEIEQIMEDELRSARLLSYRGTSIMDIEALIESHLGVDLDQYAQLDPDVLGLTQFHSRRAPTIQINRDLTGSAMDSDWCPPGIHGRWRATLAHEAAHVILHRILFDSVLGKTLGANSTELANSKLCRCLKRDVTYREGRVDWREVQANMGMAALLMPRRLFDRAARRQASELVGAGIDSVARDLAGQFAVSKEAALIRLGTLGFIPSE
jgi:hypothetical protein